MAPAPLRFLRDDSLGPDALSLIAGSEAELAALYPPEERFAFSPNALRAAGVTFFLAYRGEDPLGCGGLARLPGYGEIKRLFVRPEARGAGVAAALLSALEAHARSEGLSVIRLETGAQSPAAIRAYEKAGYHRRGAFGAYPEIGSSVFMEKPL